LYVFIAVYWYFTHDVYHMCVNLILAHIWDAFGFLRKIRCDTYWAPNWTKLETAATRNNSKHTQTFTRAKTKQGLHQSDRLEAPVRPVWPGLLGMNNTRGSTPPNPNLDLPNHYTDFTKTLGIVGTPHGSP
jgi:hypothetical protein